MVSIIAAVALNNVIGKDNDLIWHLPKDLKFFKETTKGAPVIMGRKNYESIPEQYRPLPGRQNIVITRQDDYQAPDCDVVNDLNEAIQVAKGEEIFIIGGGQIYTMALEQNIVDRMYITHILDRFDGDTFFPEFNADEWRSKVIMKHEADDKNPHSFIVKEYNK